MVLGWCFFCLCLFVFLIFLNHCKQNCQEKGITVSSYIHTQTHTHSDTHTHHWLPPCVVQKARGKSNKTQNCLRSIKLTNFQQEKQSEKESRHKTPTSERRRRRHYSPADTQGRGAVPAALCARTASEARRPAPGPHTPPGRRRWPKNKQGQWLAKKFNL